MRSPCEKTTGTMCSSTDVSTMNDAGAFEHLCQAQTYINAFKHCRKESIWKASTQKFEENLLVECCELAHAIRTHTYTPEPYLEFDICERGKPRHIKAPSIRDRVFMHALCQDILNPRIVPKLIYDNSAAIKGRGISFARKRTLAHLHRYYRKYGSNQGYVLQTDFSSFFDSIGHELLYWYFCKYVTEPEIRQLIRMVIDGFEHNVGIGIGSELSQVAGILFPSLIDHYCTTVCGCGFYARYMDDIYVMHPSLDYLKQVFAGMKLTASNLQLSFNPRKCRFSKLCCHFSYLKGQYTLSETGKVFYSPGRTALRRERRKLKHQLRRHMNGKLPLADIKVSYKSWRGNIIRQYPHMSSKTLQSFDDQFKRLFGELT